MSLLLDPHHDGSPLYLDLGPEAPHVGSVVRFRVRTTARDAAVSIWMRVGASEGQPQFYPAPLIRKDDHSRWWEAIAPLTTETTRYHFLLADAEGSQWWLDATGVQTVEPSGATDFTLAIDQASGPQNLPNTTIGYQIVPDRFARSPLAASRLTPEWAVPAKWDDVVAFEEHDPTTAAQWFGGDLDGIVEHIDHIASLGVSTLDLTSVFPGASSLREDAVEDRKVDDDLGGPDAWERLGVTVRSRGWHITGRVPEPDARPAVSYATFTEPVWSWLRAEGSLARPFHRPLPLQRLSGPSVVREYRARLAQQGWQTAGSSWNALDTYETARLRTVVVDPALHRTAVGLQFTLPGLPLIHAGDEIGVVGVNGPDSRKPMPWDYRPYWDMQTYSVYAALASLRGEYAALRKGSLRWAHVDDDVLIYLREHPAGSLLVSARRAASRATLLDVGQLDLNDGALLFSSESTSESLQAVGNAVAVPGSAGPGFWIWRL